MEELIKIRKSKEGNPIVSARDLHAILGVAGDFSHWCKRMFGYGFIKDKDYSLVENDEPVNQKFINPNPKIDYAFTLDMAKEISMIQRSEKGKKAREYFVQCEKDLAIQKQVPQQMGIEEMIIMQAQSVIALRNKVDNMEERVTLIEAKGAHYDYFAIIGYASLTKYKVDLKIAAALGRKAKSTCRTMGYVMGSIPDPRFGKVLTYPKEVLELVFNEYFGEDKT